VANVFHMVRRLVTAAAAMIVFGLFQLCDDFCFSGIFISFLAKFESGCANIKSIQMIQYAVEHPLLERECNYKPGNKNIQISTLDIRSLSIKDRYEERSNKLKPFFTQTT
jgi:hypothetical protein